MSDICCMYITYTYIYTSTHVYKSKENPLMGPLLKDTVYYTLIN